MQCTLMPPHRDGHCDWCGIQLTGKRRRWCSEGCSREFRRQHDWETAREAALVRDGYRCQRCKVLTVGSYQGDWESLPSAPSRPKWEDFVSEDAFQEAMEAFAQQWKVFLVRVVKPLGPEVNHKVPLVGKGYAWGCVHHSDNLETLCHRCHVWVTQQQRKLRRLEQAQKVYEEEMRSGRRGCQGAGQADGTEAGPGGDRAEVEPSDADLVLDEEGIPD